MNILIVYETFYGNTEKVAQAIAEALKGHGDVRVMRAAEAKAEQISGVDLLIVGSPTRAFRPCPATKAFLAAIPAVALQGVKVAAFDTRTAMDETVPGILRFMARIFGYAAQPIAASLVKKGGTLVGSPEGFFVKGSEGPLLEGELARAAEWAKTLTP